MSRSYFNPHKCLKLPFAFWSLNSPKQNEPHAVHKEPLLSSPKSLKLFELAATGRQDYQDLKLRVRIHSNLPHCAEKPTVKNSINGTFPLVKVIFVLNISGYIIRGLNLYFTSTLNPAEKNNGNSYKNINIDYFRILFIFHIIDANRVWELRSVASRSSFFLANAFNWKHYWYSRGTFVKLK